MNPNEELNDEQNQNEDDAQATGEEETSTETGAILTPADTAPSQRANLNQYQKWQENHSHLLMDGTYSQQSYIKVAESEDFEYGVQPRLAPGVVKNPDGSKELGLIAAFRVRTAFKAMDNSEETSGNKIEALKGYTVPPAGWSWHRVSNQRVSKVVQFGIPLNPTKPGALQQFLALLESNLFDKFLSTLPTPAAGWDTSLIRQARSAYSSYLMVCINQFGLFQNGESTQLWEPDSVSGELTPELVAYLGALGAQEDAPTVVTDDEEDDEQQDT